jgi:hypothetical protein
LPAANSAREAALALRVARHGGEEAVEVAAAGRRAHGRGEQEHDEN